MKSPTHKRFDSPAVKSRSTRSLARAARGFALVVRHGFPRRLAPTIPCAAINRWTWQRGTRSPARSSAFHVRLYP